MKNIPFIKFVYLIVCILTIVLLSGMESKSDIPVMDLFNEKPSDVKSPKCIQMYEYIERYSDEYNIPKYVAYNVAFKETTYMGPFHWNYNPSRTSCVGALGPMQIMPTTSYSINKVKYPNEKIMNDIRLNIETSMKLLRKLHNRYGDWSLVCGHYNTGRPIVNEYGRYCGTNKDYKSKWLSLK
jgi:soluble lytic murein transglycosylase-like protein